MSYDFLQNRQSVKPVRLLPGSVFLLSPCILLFQEFSEFIHEGTDILELAVDRCKADIGDGIKAVDALDDQLSDFGTGDLLLLAVKNLLLDLVHNAFDLVDADRTLVAGAQDSALNLLAVIGFAVVVFFDNDHGDGLYFFIGRKSSFAGITDSASADGVVLLDRPGIGNSGIFATAIRTSHMLPPF